MGDSGIVLAGALVRENSSGDSVFTDSAGTFVLSIPDSIDMPVLTIVYPGYPPKQIFPGTACEVAVIIRSGELPVNSLPGTNSGNPRLRCAPSINRDQGPLYIIDGVKAKGLDNIDPKDIESMTVFRGADATARYGLEGVNGVVLIKMKKKGRRKRKPENK